MTTVTIDAKMEGHLLVIYPFGLRVVVATIPPDVTMTDKLADAISIEWAKEQYSSTIPVHSTKVRAIQAMIDRN